MGSVIKRIAVSCLPGSISPGAQRGLGWCLSPEADAKGPVPLAWLPKYQISNEPWLLPLPGLEKLVKSALYVTSWLRGPPSLPASFAGKELGKPVFLLLLFLEVGSVKVQLKKDPGFRNQPHEGFFCL